MPESYVRACKCGICRSETRGNGVVTGHAYRPDNRRLLNVQATLSSGYTFHNFLFSYDLVGNLTQLQNQVQYPGFGGVGGPWNKTYGYDDLYRLTASAGTHNTTPEGTFTYTFSQSYDSIHNITHKTRPRPRRSTAS